jgi:hypothetical protein
MVSSLGFQMFYYLSKENFKHFSIWFRYSPLTVYQTQRTDRRQLIGHGFSFQVHVPAPLEKFVDTFHRKK